MIVKNEAENLPRLFESIQGVFDEIHITDTGSTDDTVKIAESYGAKVHHFEWCDDFAAARNASFKPVTTDFVFWMDGDDVLENKEAFIHFRDHVMKVADYWVAPYHYASDANGNAICTFARERVFKVSRGMQWRYFIHEGVIPVLPDQEVKAQVVNTWAVRHKRTEEDLKKDRSRNLSIFEKKMTEGPLDARMRYYYGKELFEAGKTEDTIPVLLSAVADPALELHDRILAIQYLCYAYMTTTKFEKVLEFAHMGAMLAPNRAEFHCILGDTFLKMGRLADSVPHYNAAKGCLLNKGQLSPIFSHEASYTVYPRNQLARVYAHLGDIDRARKEAAESLSILPDTENRTLITELDRIKTTTKGYLFAQPCEDIVFTTPPVTAYEFDPEIAKSKAMGGSETALIEMAYWLHKISGRKVKVFSPREKEGIFDGVEYLKADQVVDYFSKHKPYLHVAWRHSNKLTDAKTVVWSHDLQTQGVEATDNYDKVLCLTPFHKNFMMGTQGVPEHKIYVTRNGLKPERFNDGPWEKDPNRFVFSSSPDRGLDRAMRVLDRVREKFPDVKLHVAYGIEHLPKWGHQALHDKLKGMMEERKDWVIYEGAMQQDALMRLMKSSAYCVQPSDFIETSKITALEMACCGVYQITRAIGGCVDTLGPVAKAGMASLVDSDCITEMDYAVYVNETLTAMSEERYKRVFWDANSWTWEQVARQWLEDLPQILHNQKGAA